MSTRDNWTIDEHRHSSKPWISVRDYGSVDLDPHFHSAEEVERFVEQLRAASQRLFGSARP